MRDITEIKDAYSRHQWARIADDLWEASMNHLGLYARCVRLRRYRGLIPNGWSMFIYAVGSIAARKLSHRKESRWTSK